MLEKKYCVNCDNFVRHYMEFAGDFKPLNFGHCFIKKNINRKARFPMCEGCEQWVLKHVQERTKEQEVAKQLSNISSAIQRITTLITE